MGAEPDWENEAMVLEDTVKEMATKIEELEEAKMNLEEKHERLHSVIDDIYGMCREALR